MEVPGILLFSFVLFSSVIPRSNGQADENDGYAWFSAGLTPIPVRILPTELAEVQFPNGAVIATGQPLNLADLSDQPFSISYPGNVNDFYTFIFFDPDSPSEDDPYGSQYVQWISVNNPDQSSARNNTYGGDDIAPYYAPEPGKGTGRHRFILLVFQQTYQIDAPQLDDRTHFQYLDFAKQYRLGDPIAGNFGIVYT